METVTPEWSHKIEAEDIGKTPVRTTISASPQERKDLARRLRVDSIDFLEAELTLQRQPRNMFLHVEGRLRAKVTQPCVVTLEPVQQDVEGAVEGWFGDPASAVSLTRARHEKEGRSGNAELPVLDEKDDPEPIVDGKIDLGELVAQHLSLSLNPYPHGEGVEYDKREEVPSGEASATRRNPFAALKDWKAGKNGDN